MADRKSDRPAIVIALVLVAVLVIGEVVVYTSERSDYSAEVWTEEGSVRYEIGTDGSKDYSVVLSDNGGYRSVERLYLYCDTEVPANTGNYTVDLPSYFEQLVNLLKVRGFDDVLIVDSDGLREALEFDLGADDCAGKGLVVVSGALPGSVYTGNADDTVLGWLEAGGSLYWHGSVVGECYTDRDGIHTVEDSQTLFFGSECQNTGEADMAYVETDDGYTSALSLQNNRVRYGIDPQRVGEGRECLATGFEADGYCSVGIVQHGDGMVCVLGGTYPSYLLYDLAQVISAGIGPDSEIVEVDEGVSRGQTSGTMGASLADVENPVVYVYMGGYYPVYGSRTEL